MSQAIEVKVPDIGDYTDIPVIEVLVKAGDTVEKEQSLVTLESDKATMDVPSSAAGVVKEVKVKVGDNVSEGSLIVVLDGAGAAAAPAPAPAAAPAPAPSPAVAPAAVGGGLQEVKVPDIGDYKDIPVIEVSVKVGDRVEKEQSLVTLESDKATMDVPSSAAGVVKEVKVKVGDNVSEGSVIVVLEADGAAAPAAAPAPKQAALEKPSDAPAAPSPAPASPSALAQAPLIPAGEGGARRASHASPSVRKFARELGVDVVQVQGTGPKGRITQADVTGFIKGVMTGQRAAPAGAAAPAAGGGELNLLPWPKVDFTKFGPVDPKPLSRIKKISGANLHRNWVMIPHVTNNDEADITDLEALRVQLNKENEKAGVKITMLAFVIKAVVSALKQFPTFNASLDGDNLVFKQYYHIGFAADTPNGLVVPVIRDADKKGLIDIAKEMAELSKAARDGKLKPDQMQGGCFSISSLGGIGGTNFTPIINAPEVAILGLSRGAMKPVWDGKQFVPRLTLPLSLSYDHRVIDGAAAARFNAYLGAILADFRRVIL
ncbi:Dihydrolipoyllysine-residue acetyltransferase component of pyruvate dehydrogenase complex [Paraburkholderia domus]|uniref:Acetyltransferase component of pyruvate dehydrogenase complex n=1 Tax=Paraburkholderia domus TaxID=2793075 RepID=A0A9N8MSR1_9BURK|nr:dihydrolipoyllysine-residue acetyltransferase [Paraburkholderia domus]MBK5048724.1 dihydrolipoyllysine-residue acetyltransferase [Burkholderia sp. R-70006]MBK5060687.1 dihydrolipoyllysine-residue acetyltransferase [Burkholderia sp. R-70199]MBK5085700.1 dihydrolipoyllysine-residue acetyltransferase [Burkholderia sp. R-69927]MBK5120717.1 dihydrolipoyllysine-residue acetyltransferase [Burkholderia sp. R-69980]MBK5165886.1 dihydrolipoyllysine-residue acetyltransferase [Burkholderia sp. R-70211]